MKGITDRNTTIRKSYASSIAVITTVAKESSVNKLIQSLRDVYLAHEGKYFLHSLQKGGQPMFYMFYIF